MHIHTHACHIAPWRPSSLLRQLQNTLKFPQNSGMGQFGRPWGGGLRERRRREGCLKSCSQTSLAISTLHLGGQGLHPPGVPCLTATCLWFLALNISGHLLSHTALWASCYPGWPCPARLSPLTAAASGSRRNLEAQWGQLACHCGVGVRDTVEQTRNWESGNLGPILIR